MDNEEVRPMLLTTTDNPFNPFTQPVDWRAFDEDHGYYCREYLARVADTSPDLPDEEYTLALNKAVLSIIEFNDRFKDPRLPEGVDYTFICEDL